LPWTGGDTTRDIEIKFQNRKTSGSVIIGIKKTKFHENKAKLGKGKFMRVTCFKQLKLSAFIP